MKADEFAGDVYMGVLIFAFLWDFVIKPYLDWRKENGGAWFKLD